MSREDFHDTRKEDFERKIYKECDEEDRKKMNEGIDMIDINVNEIENTDVFQLDFKRIVLPREEDEGNFISCGEMARPDSDTMEKLESISL